ncbi:MAG: hypothetical protein WA151_16105, partial [Desulfatirhabdiaceae bacterium]
MEIIKQMLDSQLPPYMPLLTTFGAMKFRLFTATGTWTCPVDDDGVAVETEVFAIAVGGGGGGGATYNESTASPTAGGTSSF